MEFRLPTKKGVSGMAQIAAVLVGMLGAGAMYRGTAPDTAGNLSSNVSEEDLLQDFQDMVSSLTRKVGTEVLISHMETNVSNVEEGEHTAENYGSLHINVQNAGETTVNTSEFTLIPVTGERADGNCFTPRNSTMLAPDDSYYCNTGIVYPKAGQSVTLKVLLEGSSKTRRATCVPQTTAETVC